MRQLLVSFTRLASWTLAGSWQMYYQYTSLQKLGFQMCVFWKAFKLKSKCRCLLTSVMLTSSCAKPYLPAELTLENLAAVLASFILDRLGHVPENAMKACYGLNTSNVNNGFWKILLNKGAVHRYSNACASVRGGSEKSRFDFYNFCMMDDTAEQLCRFLLTQW